MEELSLTIIGKEVTGMYHWLPVEKDQRKGSLSGELEGNSIRAKYIFMQEGIQNEADIIIHMEETKASISGGAPELGLEAVLKKVNCE